MTGNSKSGKQAAAFGGWFLLVVGALLLGFQPSALAQLDGSGLSQARPGGLSGLQDSFQQPEFLPVEEAYRLAVEAEDATTLRLVWQMPPGYYLYQHAFDFSLDREDADIAVDPEYPPALTREDEYFGRVQVYYDSADITLRSEAAVPGARLTIVSQGCADAGLCYPPRTQHFLIDAEGSVVETAAALPARAGTDRVASGAGGGADGALWFMLLLAFTGGLILNLMPCVLPVLSLKVLGFAMACPEERHRHGLLYSLGVVLSFLAIAVALLSLRSTGQAIGWGFQLQSPTVVLALAYLFVVLGLAMSGVLELGNRFMNLGSDLCNKGGAQGSFFTGVLAVVVASPCTAPFMGTALGYALVQPAPIGLAVFAALGCGMALPMLLLSYSETARRHMPKPGPWMERLKQGLAFPLYATALWLFWVAGRQTGVDVMAAALLGALVLALGLWLWRGGAWLARGVSLVCIGFAVLLVSWRPTVTGPEESSLPEGAVAFTPQALNELRAAGKPVFVDVTADWCITCLANERAVLGHAAVQDAFRANGVTYMVADWTDYDSTIADFVSSHGRSGIPLYVLYSRNDEPRLLPQILRRSTVLDALDTLSETRVATAQD